MSALWVSITSKAAAGAGAYTTPPHPPLFAQERRGKEGKLDENLSILSIELFPEQREGTSLPFPNLLLLP